MRKLNTLPSANMRKLPNCTRLPRLYVPPRNSAPCCPTCIDLTAHSIDCNSFQSMSETLQIIACVTGTEIGRLENAYREVERVGYLTPTCATEFQNCGLHVVMELVDALGMGRTEALASINRSEVSSAEFDWVLTRLAHNLGSNGHASGSSEVKA